MLETGNVGGGELLEVGNCWRWVTVGDGELLEWRTVGVENCWR